MNIGRNLLRSSLPALSFAIFFPLTFASAGQAAAPAASPTDALRRLNPRSAVTAFLEACHSQDYTRAAQYLDLDEVSPRLRAEQGPVLARELQSILNSARSFNVLQLSQDPQGNPTDDPDPNIEHVVNVAGDDHSFTLELQHVNLAGGPSVWLFSPATVRAIPELAPEPTESAIEARLPRFLVSIHLLDTPLWKWIALLLLALLDIAVFRLLVRLLSRAVRELNNRVTAFGKWGWIEAIIEPLLIIASVMGFGILERLIGPSALSRLYIGRALLLVFVWAVAWGIINLLELALNRIDSLLSSKQRIVSHSLIYLGRRAMRVLVVVFAAIVVLSNWGYDMTTIIAGLGVGGIAVALAAQQTIANVFGGVSVIGDNPVMIGDYGKFGGLEGRIEDIGMRSTRVRTPQRSVVSVPNASFAGMNLENLSIRDKMFFNPTLQVKRATPKDQIRRCMDALHRMLSAEKNLELGPSSVKISAYTSASFALEISAYVLTEDPDEFNKRQTDLFLKIDDVVSASGIELV